MIQTFVGLFDDHYPENVYEKLINKFLKAEKPDIMVLGGDNWDCDLLSHWGQESKFKQLGTDYIRTELQKEANGFHNFIKNRITAAKSKKVYYIIGNHEDWIRQYQEKYASAHAELTLDGLARMSDLGVEIIQNGRYVKLGKLLIMHGNNLKSNMNHARSNVIEWQKTILYGHFHTSQSSTNITPVHTDLPQMGQAIGGLTTRDATYNKHRPNKTIHQFVYGYVDTQTGFFNYYPITIIKGQFIWKGKVYKQ